MSKQTTNLLLAGAALFILYKVWQSKPKVTSTATAQQQPGVATGNNSSIGATLGNWGQTIGSLYSGISSIFSGNSTSNASNPPAGSTAPGVIQPPPDLGLDPGFELTLPSSSGGS